MNTYTIADRIEDFRCDLYMNWPGAYAPVATVRVIAAAANAARAVGMRWASRKLAAWAYDVADVPMAATAFNEHRRLLPWAWNHDRTLLAWWAYSPAIRRLFSL